MTNKEFYRDEIFEIACKHDKVAVVKGKLVCCMAEEVCCEDCDFFKFGSSCNEAFFEWLEKEHKEKRIQPEVKKLKQDDRVLVSNDGEYWLKRHFKKYDPEKDTVYAHECGYTSWTTYDGSAIEWTYAKLPEEEQKEKKIDWATVPVNTKILVRDYRNQKYIERCFAKYENGKVYAWIEGKKSNETKECFPWSYAKLAEGEE